MIYAEREAQIGYNPSWEDEFKWLKYVDGGMLCTTKNKLNLAKYELMNPANSYGRTNMDNLKCMPPLLNRIGLFF